MADCLDLLGAGNTSRTSQDNTGRTQLHREFSWNWRGWKRGLSFSEISHREVAESPAHVSSAISCT